MPARARITVNVAGKHRPWCYRPRMPDSRLPLTIRSVGEGYAIAFADGEEHICIHRRGVSDETTSGALTADEALELAKEVARALMLAWGDPLRSVA